MALSIKSDEADHLARELTAVTGESLTEAVTVALRERLARARLIGRPGPGSELRSASDHFRAESARDGRSDDEILGYDAHGLLT